MKKFFVDKDLGELLFLIGGFLLPSAFSISIVFLLFSLTSSLLKYKVSFLKDKYNNFFLIGGILLIISSIFHSLNSYSTNQYISEINLSWIGLANWLPLFLCFYCFQIYLKTKEQRKNFGLVILIGTFPVIISGLGQSFFDWDGPLQTLGGLIIWYQRPLEDITELTGLFNNPNYAGLWLNIVWPFGLASLLINKENFLGKISSLFFIFSIAITTVLTNSRSAWLGLLIGLIFTFRKKIIQKIPLLFFGSLFFLVSYLIPFLSDIYKSLYYKIIPNQSWISPEQTEITRIDIWRSALKNILSSPLFGTGHGSFPVIFKTETGIWKGHTHNIVLELMNNYGVPAGIIIISAILTITYISIKNSFLINKKNTSIIFDKAWVTSLFIILTSQMVDVQYYDGRISILLWILLAGARNLIE